MTDLEEQEVRQRYRITVDPTPRVLKFWRGEWVVAYYCSSEDSAAVMLEKCVRREMEYSRMTPEQRIAAVMRRPHTPRPRPADR